MQNGVPKRRNRPYKQEMLVNHFTCPYKQTLSITTYSTWEKHDTSFLWPCIDIIFITIFQFQLCGKLEAYQMKEQFTWPRSKIRLPWVPFGQDEKDKQTRHHPTQHLHLVHCQQTTPILVYISQLKRSGIRNSKFIIGRCQPYGTFISWFWHRGRAIQ